MLKFEKKGLNIDNLWKFWENFGALDKMGSIYHLPNPCASIAYYCIGLKHWHINLPRSKENCCCVSLSVSHVKYDLFILAHISLLLLSDTVLLLHDLIFQRLSSFIHWMFWPYSFALQAKKKAMWTKFMSWADLTFVFPSLILSKLFLFLLLEEPLSSICFTPLVDWRLQRLQFSQEQSRH